MSFLLPPVFILTYADIVSMHSYLYGNFSAANGFVTAASLLYHQLWPRMHFSIHYNNMVILWITLTAGGFRFTPPPLPRSSLPESESTSLPESAFWGTMASSSSSSSSLPPPALLPSLSDELAGCRQTAIRRLRWISHCNALQSRKLELQHIMLSLTFHIEAWNKTVGQRERDETKFPSRNQVVDVAVSITS